jgi:hypothetical protein
MRPARHVNSATNGKVTQVKELPMSQPGRRKLLTALAVAVLLAFTSVPLLAHAPFVEAQIVCNPASGLVIDYTAFSWVAGPGGANPQINVYVSNLTLGTTQLVDSQPFAAPDYEFSNTAPLPAGSQTGDMIEVLVLAVGTWDSGSLGGQSTYVHVQVPEGTCTGLGRFTGGGSQIRLQDDVRVTRGLTIHCDLLLSNNLEVNWQGNQFHMLEHLETVACTDSPLIDQTPPDAPLDTLIGIGTGRYNGVDGFTVEFTLVDYGEPGKNDRMRIFIYETANPANVVLNVPLQTLSGGNLQAHFDQPHKK